VRVSNGVIGLSTCVIDRITNRDLDIDALVEPAAAALIIILRTAAQLDPSTTLAAPIRMELETSFEVGGTITPVSTTRRGRPTAGFESHFERQ
jgi:hypothetical protein